MPPRPEPTGALRHGPCYAVALFTLLRRPSSARSWKSASQMSPSSAGIRPSVRDVPYSAQRDFALGIGGFTWRDLHDAERLAALLDAFDAQLRADAPELATVYLGARATGGTGLAPLAKSNLLVEVSRHVSRFVSRLFGVEKELAAIRHATRAEDPVFRFKKEFLGRRVKRARTPPPPLGAAEARALELIRNGFPSLTSHGDVEHCLASAACELLDLEAAFLPPRGATTADPSPEQVARAESLCAAVPAFAGVPPAQVATAALDLLAGWCRALEHEAPHRVGSWASFREPEPMRAVRPGSDRAAAAVADPRADRDAPARRLRAHRPAHEPARGPGRGGLLPLLPRARQGLVLEGLRATRTGAIEEEPARRRARRLPARREDLRDAPAAEATATRSARSRSSSSTTRCAPAPATASATTA